MLSHGRSVIQSFLTNYLARNENKIFLYEVDEILNFCNVTYKFVKFWKSYSNLATILKLLYLILSYEIVTLCRVYYNTFPWNAAIATLLTIIYFIDFLYKSESSIVLLIKILNQSCIMYCLFIIQTFRLSFISNYSKHCGKSIIVYFGGFPILLNDLVFLG